MYAIDCGFAENIVGLRWYYYQAEQETGEQAKMYKVKAIITFYRYSWSRAGKSKNKLV